jgi:hypothetical protein
MFGAKLRQAALAVALAGAAWLCAARIARADAIIGNGAPESCTETAFNSAWSAGGKISFNCGAAQKTITLTRNYAVNEPVWLDGGGLVAFRGGSSQARFTVYAAFTVTRMTFSDFFSDSAWGSVMYIQTGHTLVEDSTFAGNRVSSGGGGAIYNIGQAVLRRVVLLNNRAGYGGGAISNGPDGQLILEQTRFEDNAAYAGGGLYNNGGSVIISQSLFAGNVVTEAGGAIANDDDYGAATKFGQIQITNATFGANSARVGGGLAVRRAGSAITLTNSTLNGNISTGGYGSNVYSVDGADVRMKNTILAGGVGADNCLSVTPFTSLGNNISSDGSCVGNTLPDRNNTNPQLQPLANNGGFSRTYFPSAGSPAIDNGANAGCPATDQRGISRPAGAACDIGAVEALRLSRSVYLPLMRR